MRELKVVGLDADGKNIICEGGIPGEQFKLPVDDRLQAAMRGDAPTPEQPQLDIEVTNLLSPKEIQARIRAGASVEQVATASGSDIARIRRFAHPVLLERSRAAELATAAHPLLADGPSVLTLLETISTALVARGLNPARLGWDAWRNEDGRWTVQLSWQVGLSDNHAHFCFTPGAHGGTVTAMDDPASELIDPDFKPPLRPLAPVARLAFETPAPTAQQPGRAVRETQAPPAPAAEAPVSSPASSRRGKPAIPAWEDVLLGVRSGGALAASRWTRAAVRRAAQRHPRAGHPDPGAEHEPAPDGSAPPAPQGRRQPPGRHDVEPDGQQRMDPDQSEAEHHNRDGGDRGDEPGYRQTRPPRHGRVSHEPTLARS